MTTRTRLMTLATVFSACVVAGPFVAGQTARPFATWATVPIRNGPNDVDIDGDGRVDLVFRASRDNGNAHGYDLVTFYRHGEERNTPWELVPFFDRKGETATEFRTYQGADCVLHGIALVRDPSQSSAPVTAIVADREFGRSFADPAKVTFTVYRLARNREGIVGSPPVYFEQDRIIEAKANYCDVNEAFAVELGIRVAP